MSHHLVKRDDFECYCLPMQSLHSGLEIDGPLLGHLVTTIEVQGCNLHCKYCRCNNLRDPKTTYFYNLKDIFQDVIKQQTRYVKIIGGDPLLHKDEIIGLSQALIDEKKIVNICVNGSYDLKMFLEEFWKLEEKNIILTMYYKLGSSEENSKMYESNLRNLRSVDNVVFEPHDESDQDEIKAIISKRLFSNVYIETERGLQRR